MPCPRCGDPTHSASICWTQGLPPDLSRLWDGVALWVALCWYDDRAYEYEENQVRIRRRMLQSAQGE